MHEEPQVKSKRLPSACTMLLYILEKMSCNKVLINFSRPVFMGISKLEPWHTDFTIAYTAKLQFENNHFPVQISLSGKK